MHEYQQKRRGNLLINFLAQAWQNQGLEVKFSYGIREYLEVNLVIPQIDLTQIPSEYINYLEAYPNVVNRKVTDISKRRISKNLLYQGEDYPGPVIIKTNNNFGGHSDYHWEQFKHPLRARLFRLLVPFAEFISNKSYAWRRVLRRYPVYNNLSEVPAGVFKNENLVIERFLPEKEGSRYFLRHYLFLGDHSRSVRVAGPTPFLKRRKSSLVDEGVPVPEEVIRFRQQLGMDYGKIDYTICAQQVNILDVNPTPGAPGSPEAAAPAVKALADGIWSLLRDSSKGL